MPPAKAPCGQGLQPPSMPRRMPRAFHCPARRAMRGVVERARRPGRGIEGARRLRPHRACGAGIAGARGPDARPARRRAQRRARPRAASRRAGSRRSSLDAERRAAGRGPGPGGEVAPAQPGRPRSVGFGPIVARGEPSRRGRPLSPGWTRHPIEPRLRSSASAAAGRSSRARRRSPGAPASRRSRSRRRPVVPVRPNASRGRRCRPMPEPSRQRDALQALQGASVTPPRAPFGFRGLGAPHRRHRRPRLAARKRPGHGPRRRTPGWVLLGSLSPNRTA